MTHPDYCIAFVMKTQSLQQRWSVTVFALLLGVTVPALAAEMPTPPVRPAAGDLTAQILYQYLLAEIASARGQSPLAVSAMTDLANQTQDAKIARRAAEIALQGRNYEEALKATRIWLAHEPDSAAAHQMLISLLAVLGRTEELKAHLKNTLAQDAAQAPELLLRLNRLFARVSDKLEALRLVEEISEPYLNLPEAHFARAQAAYAAERREAAADSLEQALALRPNWEAAILFKALLQQAQPAQVVATLEPFVQTYPQAVDARLAMARALVAEKRFIEAMAQFEQVQAQQPDNLDVKFAIGLIALQLQDYAKAEQIFRDLIDRNYGESNLLRTYLGQMAEDRKEYLDAANWYRQVTPGPQYQAAHARAARLLTRAGRLDEARALIRSMPAGNDTERAKRSIAEAHLLSESNRHEEALALLEQALRSMPEQADLMYDTALAADKVGKHARMEVLLRRLIKDKPDHAHAYNALGYSFAERGVHLDEAQQLIDKALALQPNDPFILDSKGWVLYRRGDLEGALSALQSAFAQRPDAEIAAHLGEVLWALGRQPEARQLWEEARRNHPGNETLADTIKKFVP